MIGAGFEFVLRVLDDGLGVAQFQDNVGALTHVGVPATGKPPLLGEFLNPFDEAGRAVGFPNLPS